MRIKSPHTLFLSLFGAMLIGSPVLAPALAIAAPADPAKADPATIVTATANSAGVLRLRSNHNVDETVARIRTALAAKGIRFFDAIDQHALADDAKLALGKSTLVLFGNPPLGVQFLQANRYAGLDWPVRMLVVEESDGSVWLAWNDFAWIKQRYALTDRDAQINMANEVAASIATEAAR